MLPAAPAATVDSPATLIYCGWYGATLPTPAWVAAHKAFLETQPFGGLGIYLRNDATGTSVTANVMSATPVSYSSVVATLAPLKATTFTTLRDNFGLVQGMNPPDFFDDWTVTIQNFSNLAQGLKDAGLKGFFFDNEQYFRPWGLYPNGVRYPNHSLQEYEAQARLRGQQVMTAMVAKFPEIAVISMHGPSVSEPKVPQPLFPLWYMSNQLLGPFYAGFMQGVAASTLNIDGGELYHLRSATQFLQSYNWRKYTEPTDAINSTFIPAALRPSWPGKMSVAFGVYDRPFRGASMDSTTVRSTLANALRQADHYVWFYTEGSSFLKPASQGGASATWVDAVRQARIDAGLETSPPPPVSPSGPPSGAPAAPSHFSAAASSSSAVDLSWWDMSTNESSFEVERKTGAAGTWLKVLTIGANISTMDDVGLSAGTTYVYRVRAVNVSGASAYSSEATVTTSGTSAGNGPAAPTNLTLRTLASARVGITWWDMSSGETGFEVERKTGSAGAWSRIATKGANVSIHDDYTVTPGVIYSYRVRSVNASGASAYTNVISVTAQ